MLIFPCAHLACGHISSSLNHSKRSHVGKTEGFPWVLGRTFKLKQGPLGLQPSPGNEQVAGNGLHRREEQKGTQG